MGRPKGSKNKPKVTEAATPSNANNTVVKRRGRPPGVSNKPTVNPTSAPVAVKRRGRPPGSKNRPKDNAPVAAAPVDNTPPAPPSSAPSSEAPKRRGRPPKVVAPVIPSTALPPVLSSPPTLTLNVPPEVTRTACDEGQDDRSPEIQGVPPYSYAQLNHPALNELEAHAAAFAVHASPARAVFFDEKVQPGITRERAVLKLLVDFFEINLPALIVQYEKAT